MTATAKQPRKTLPGVVTSAKWLPPRIGLYGTPGIGKSTFATGAPNPIFIPTESGVENLDVARFPAAKTLAEFLAHLAAVADEEHGHEAVVIDTLNGLMDLYYEAKKDVLNEKGKPAYDFANFGGFSGWGAVGREIRSEILAPLNRCQQRGMFVIMLAHTGEYKRKNPLGDDLEVAAPSIPRWVWKEIHPWLDVIGRADYVYTTRRINDVGRAKASTDIEVVDGVKVKVRQLTFDGGVEQDCKARVGYELPPTMPLSWESFASHLGNVHALAEEIRAMWHLMPEQHQAATLNWLGVDGAARLDAAGRSKLSQLRNRLLEAKTVADAESKAADKAVGH